jgi:hypothetical protein
MNSDTPTLVPTTPTQSSLLSPKFDDQPLMALLQSNPAQMSPEELAAYVQELQRSRTPLTLRAKVTDSPPKPAVERATSAKRIAEGIAELKALLADDDDAD